MPEKSKKAPESDYRAHMNQTLTIDAAIAGVVLIGAVIAGIRQCDKTPETQPQHKRETEPEQHPIPSPAKEKHGPSQEHRWRAGSIFRATRMNMIHNITLPGNNQMG